MCLGLDVTIGSGFIVFIGRFEPFHNGHLEIVERAARLFDRVIVAAMRNPQKGEPLFTLAERKKMIEESVAHLPNVEIDSFSSLVVDLAKKVGQLKKGDNAAAASKDLKTLFDKAIASEKGKR